MIKQELRSETNMTEFWMQAVLGILHGAPIKIQFPTKKKYVPLQL